MNRSVIPFGKSRSFSELFLAYTENPAGLSHFYTYALEIASFKQAIEDRKEETINRELLVRVLKNQYKRSGLEEPKQNSRDSGSSIDLLLRPDTFTVCTGHQLCLFTGPLYFIYKLVTVIKLAAQLKDCYPDFNFVPVYWMASEDHDFEEINHLQLFGKKLVWESALVEQAGMRAVGGIETKSLEPLLAQLKMILGEDQHANQLFTILEKAYFGHANLADATRFLVHELMGKYGLVVLDPDNTELKAEFSAIVKDDLLHQTNFKLVDSTVRELIAAGFSAQVNPREINCFYFQDGLRKRIIGPVATGEGSTREAKRNEGIQPEKEILFSNQMLEELDSHPEKFSPNVVLRPLYQQKILPNLAYVGGPGELAYWLEFKKMFEQHGINFPMLVPRNFALLPDSKSAQVWTKFSFSAEDYFQDTEQLIKSFVLKNAQTPLSLSAEQEKLHNLFEQISAVAASVDSTLKNNVLAEEQKVLNALKGIETKLLRAQKQKNEDAIGQIRKVKARLFPEGELQERTDNFIPFYCKYGPGFIEMLLKEFNPFEKGMLVLSE